MDDLGKPLWPRQVDGMQDNRVEVGAIMEEIDAEIERIKKYGVSTEALHKRGEMTVWERIEYLVDPGTFCPLHTIYDPEQEESGQTNVVDGLAKLTANGA